MTTRVASRLPRWIALSRLGGLLLAGLAILPFRLGAAETIELLVRGDDMGVCQAGNEACIQSFKEGIMRSTEVIVPGAWFLDAARLLAANTQLDVGVHLTLTSEWERCKWRPLTHAPSLVDANGYFYPMTSQRADFPPNTGFIQARPKLDEVERELRAQIELARKHIPRISHVSAHMGTATCTPELRALTVRLAAEYKLRLEMSGLSYAAGFKGRTPQERIESLAATVEKIGSGKWLLVEHPGLDTPEMRGLGHKGYEYVAEERDAVTKAFTHEKVKEVVQRRGIRLIAYKDLPLTP